MLKGKIKYPVILIEIILLIAGTAWPVHAVDKEAVQVSPASLSDSFFKPRLGTYFYCFEFNRINIGSACITILREDDLYKMQVLARTNDKVDYVYKIRYQGESIIETDPLSPVETKIIQKVKSTEKDIFMKFQDDGSVQSLEKVIKKGRTVDDEVRTVYPGKSTVDPFSATYLARGFDWKIGVKQFFTVYTGKSNYELCLRCIDKTVIEMPGEKREAWVILPTAKSLDPEKRKPEEKKKPAEIKIYLSADERKDVLKIEANHAIGSFLVLLDRFEPAIDQNKGILDNTQVSVNK